MELRRRGRVDWKIYLYVLPVMLFVTAFILYPILFNFKYSFFEWKGLKVDTSYFVGWKNYEMILTDKVTPIMVKNTFVYMLCTGVVQLGFALLLAYLFSRGYKGSAVVKTIVFVPVVASYTVVGAAFVRLLDKNFGEIDAIIKALGMGNVVNVNWLGDPTAALYTLVLIAVWKWTGYNMILYYSSLMALPEEIIEAARIDGANGVQTFFKVVFPMLRGAHFTNLILNCIGCLKVFDHVQVLTGGGPGNATQFFSTYIYKNANELFRQGYACAMAVVLFLITLGITAFQLKLYDKD